MQLPELSPTSFRAKLDTGARTSALHAFRTRVFDHDGEKWVRFEVHPRQKSRRDSTTVEVPLLEMRKVRSSDGAEELRPVILTPLSMGGRKWDIEVTLTRRDAMSYRLLLGRTALRGRVLVDSGRSHIVKAQEAPGL